MRGAEARAGLVVFFKFCDIAWVPLPDTGADLRWRVATGGQATSALGLLVETRIGITEYRGFPIHLPLSCSEGRKEGQGRLPHEHNTPLP